MTVMALIIIGWVAAVATSGEAGISKLEPWWRGLSAIFFLMALLWTAHFFLPRRIPLTASVILAAVSAMITGFSVAFFRPFGWGDLLWPVSALFASIAILKLLEPTGRTQ